jgi:hypothetical protein
MTKVEARRKRIPLAMMKELETTSFNVVQSSFIKHRSSSVILPDRLQRIVKAEHRFAGVEIENRPAVGNPLVLRIVMKNRGAEFRVIDRFDFFHPASGDGFEFDRYGHEGAKLTGLPIAGIRYIVFEFAIGPPQPARFATERGTLQEFRFELLPHTLKQHACFVELAPAKVELPSFGGDRPQYDAEHEHHSHNDPCSYGHVDLPWMRAVDPLE